jgi:hypothetical protein
MLARIIPAHSTDQKLVLTKAVESIILPLSGAFHCCRRKIIGDICSALYYHSIGLSKTK